MKEADVEIFHSRLNFRFRLKGGARRRGEYFLGKKSNHPERKDLTIYWWLILAFTCCFSLNYMAKCCHIDIW